MVKYWIITRKTSSNNTINCIAIYEHNFVFLLLKILNDVILNVCAWYCVSVYWNSFESNLNYSFELFVLIKFNGIRLMVITSS